MKKITPNPPTTLFTLAENIHPETLLIQASETLAVSVRQTHLDHTILPRAPQNHAHLQGFSKRLVKSPWFGIRA